MSMTKDVVIFYLRRRLIELEGKATVDQTELAKAGLSYGERIQAVAEAARNANQVELDAYRAALQCVEQNMK